MQVGGIYAQAEEYLRLPDEDDWRGKTTEQVAVTVVLIKLYTNYSEHAIYVATDSAERQVDSTKALIHF